MKELSNIEKLLDLPYAPEAEQYLDELERSGQFRVGLEAELDDAEPGDLSVGNDYAWGRGSGSVAIQDWWTSGRVTLRLGPGILPGDISIARVEDSLVIRTQDGLDHLLLEGYLGLIPDASTLCVIFPNGNEWSGAELLARIGNWLTRTDTGEPDPVEPAPNH